MRVFVIDLLSSAGLRPVTLSRTGSLALMSLEFTSLRRLTQ